MDFFIYKFLRTSGGGYLDCIATSPFQLEPNPNLTAKLQKQKKKNV